ncbi:MAG TPA: hypothetical protein VK763_08605 [Terriglobales bacterium]|nr:hypothetical protein [Terriglobales bacterium]
MKAVYRVIGIAAVLASATAIAAGQTSSPARDSGAPGSLSCSPAPCILPPMLSSEGTSANIFAPVAANPKNPTQLIVGSQDGNCGHFTQIGFHVSSDAGSTWSTTCLTYFNEFGRTWEPLSLPLVGYDLMGTAYIAGYFQDTDGLGYSLMGIETSSDGVTWSTPTAAVGNGGSVIFYAALSVDQSPSSSYVNSVYVAGVNLNGNELLVSRSRDGGKSWTQALVATDPSSIDYDPSLAVGKDGTVYLAWMHCPPHGSGVYCANSMENVALSKSSDGGVTWSEPKIITRVLEVPNPCNCYPFGAIPNTTVGAPNTPALGVDNSSGPYSGRLYATMFEWTGTYMRVLVIHSSDGGNTWSRPVPVAPASETHDQFFPWISVSPTGLVGVSWFDRRNDPANVDYQAYAAISSDGGETFQQNVQLTTAFSNPDDNGYDGILGDYAGNTWDGPNYFVAAWMDTSNGVNSQDYIGGIRVK